ncbi:ribosomal protein S5 domain 2-type protein [Kockovaella imperatae]|uniref:Phosphomevalonate kinase n=1 Tax=Kockovaella imperatae TaxID=4999 RepID=A0A1Y1USH7_9TREE|nr:ribosomal protein S5 domain 2-type protein [Kockovaella imperatae]ORX40912.1 ribosomal protein S5 domain 2-type protein [Kockovaella imperatae]
MERSSTSHTVVSAPGKVLLAGGYLVLDRAYSGLVVSTSSRFYCVVLDNEHRPPRINVRAGQFPTSSSTWSYDVERQDGLVKLSSISSAAGRNKFIEITLTKALQVAFESGVELQHSLDLVVLADNDFYSQREQLGSRPRTLSSLASLTPFSPLPRPIHQTNKTGLGSSAALVTSITAAVLQHLKAVTIQPEAGPSRSIDLIHNLAQLSHCTAQGKVGSGFDISSAVYGTHQYKRFSPSILSSVQASDPLLPLLRSPDWDYQAIPFRLPKGLRLLLADVDAGTDTPSFVGKVLKWREENVEVSKKLWDELGKANDDLGEQLRDLSEMEKVSGYDQQIASAGRKLDPELTVHAALARISESLQLIRSYLQQMSSLSQVPIEPPEQTRLLDTCTAIPGVIGGGVPGAGGFDAIFLLLIDSTSVIEAVEHVWSTYKEMSVCPLSARQSDGGLKVESLSIPGLYDAMSRV